MGCLTDAEVAEMVPAIDAAATCGGVFEPDAMDIDTGKVVQAVSSILK